MRRVLAALAFLVLAAAPARAQPLVADLSSHLIAITAGFAGTELLLFGATEGEGDVVVLVRGPEGETAVRRKARVAGIWLNTEELRFSGVPAYYRVAASRPLGEFLTPALRQRHQIGSDFLRLAPMREANSEAVQAFRAGLIRNKERAQLYEPEPGRVTFLGPRLFRTRIFFPANVPTGAYTVEVLLIRNGQVAAAQSTPMFVSKVGIGAEIYDFAHTHAAWYGILAVLIAVFAGWAAGAVFRKS
ncbi:MAG: TIGR02186 family protein [Azospirillum sp.]|nr:TIGR02186 family protein [Azospirillum sp.]MCZ8123692.1 TIGR02186 family protein [Magnetospirillum sp.]